MKTLECTSCRRHKPAGVFLASPSGKTLKTCPACRARRNRNRKNRTVGTPRTAPKPFRVVAVMEPKCHDCSRALTRNRTVVLEGKSLCPTCHAKRFGVEA